MKLPAISAAFVWSSVVLLVAGNLPGQDSILALENARVIVGTGEVKEGVTVVIKGDRISGIGKFAIPAGVTTIDLHGMTVMPGLIDVHVHLLAGVSSKGEASTREFLEKVVPGNLEKFLSRGVTTIKSTADPVNMVLPVREELRAGKRKGPRLLLAGPAFTSTGGHPAVSICKGNEWCRKELCVEVDDSASALRIVRSLVEKKVDAIKIVYDGGKPGRTKLPESVMKAIIEEGHRNEIRVTVHTGTQQDAIDAVKAGADGLEHGVSLGLISSDQIGTLMKRQGVFYVPTLSVWNRGGPQRVSSPKANLKVIYDAGVKIALGTDTFGSMEPGVTTVRELELMIESGLSNEAAIEAATRNAAEHLGLGGELGTVEVGKIADLIIVDGDPLKDISSLHSLAKVIQSGRIVQENE
jgi:imidazolonepropionase-like amidohydrolase